MISGHQISADNRRKHVNPRSLYGYKLGNTEESAAWCTKSKTVQMYPVTWLSAEHWDWVQLL